MTDDAIKQVAEEYRRQTPASRRHGGQAREFTPRRHPRGGGTESRNRPGGGRRRPRPTRSPCPSLGHRRSPILSFYQTRSLMRQLLISQDFQPKGAGFH